MIAQLKQEVTSHYDSLEHSPPTPHVHDKQPLYQNIGVPPVEFKGKLGYQSGGNACWENNCSFHNSRS